MTDKKFTDEEIIKAIGNLFKNTDGRYELAIKNSTKGVCGEKQYYCIPNGVYDLIMRQSSFIDRQKSEIERLESANDEKFRQWDMLAEKAKQHYADLYNEAKDILKAEAYKEFAAKLKEKSFKTIRNYGITRDVVEVCDIDNLLKEMVGEGK
jgi:hypothetical protein